MSSPPYLQIKNLSAKFTSQLGDLEALENISFVLNRSEFVCIIGPSGCGKSTLLRVIAGLIKPTQGQVFFNGQPITQPCRKIGMVFQQSNLLPWRTVRENITLPLEINTKVQNKKAVADHFIKRVGLTGFEDELPDNLSGGMAQRTAIARVLAQNPEVLLLDEPFGQLDAITREQMGSELLHLWERDRRTVLMVTHDVEEAVLLSDRVIVLTKRPGQIADTIQVPLPRPRGDTERSNLILQKVADSLRHTLRSGLNE